MKAIYHLLKFELRRLAAALGLFAALLALWYWLLGTLPDETIGEDDFATRILVLQIIGFMIVAVMFTVMAVWIGQGQPSRRPDAFWRTRPIEARSVIVVKLVMFLGLLVAFCLVGNLAKVGWGFSWSQAFASGWLPLVACSGPGIVLMLLAAMAGNWPRFFGLLMGFIVIIAGIFVLIDLFWSNVAGAAIETALEIRRKHHWMVDGGLDYVADPQPGRFYTVFAIACAMLAIVAFWLDLKARRIRRVAGVLLATVPVALLVASLWPYSPPAVLRHLPRENHQASLEIGERTASKKRRCTIRFARKGGSDRWLDALQLPRLTFEAVESDDDGIPAYRSDPHYWSLGESGRGSVNLAAYEALGAAEVSFLFLQGWLTNWLNPAMADGLRDKFFPDEEQQFELRGLLGARGEAGSRGTVSGLFHALEMGYTPSQRQPLKEGTRLRAGSLVIRIGEIFAEDADESRNKTAELVVQAAVIGLRDPLNPPLEDQLVRWRAAYSEPRLFLVSKDRSRAIELPYLSLSFSSLYGWNAETHRFEIPLTDVKWLAGRADPEPVDFSRLHFVVLEPKILKQLRVEVVETPWQLPYGRGR